ncbi:hypothetical protein RRG08_029597 [Elysia crispata]|uniref:RGS domain-containing protein n=1 Tax=Elysia crispata TaxID=231223 RepID=A0AAE0XPD9_9GAST|nr:hypothetical protein RRG08_029597 [Elysia crispata]
MRKAATVPICLELFKQSYGLAKLPHQESLIKTVLNSLVISHQVSLDSRVREVINRNMVEPTPHTFDEAQLQIWTLMHRDSYPRFLNSQVYKRLLQQLS